MVALMMSRGAKETADPMKTMRMATKREREMMQMQNRLLDLFKGH
jgi:hypothetical protein